MELTNYNLGAFLLVVASCQAYQLFGEEKRQGLIPLPRVGRSYYTLPHGHPSLRYDLEDVDDDVIEGAMPIRFTRGLFAPRLGRKKRSVDSLDETSGPSVSDIDDLRDVLLNTPWAVVALKGLDKKSTGTAFSPRLGRAMVPRLGKKRSDANLDEDKRAVAAFSPRLGRANTAFSPRLGRSGFERSAFSPRLGRSFDSDSQISDDSRSS